MIDAKRLEEIRELMQELATYTVYFSSNRRIGHSTAVKIGADATNALVVCESWDDGQHVVSPNRRVPRRTLEKFRGARLPLVFDNFALERIFAGVGLAIRDLLAEREEMRIALQYERDCADEANKAAQALQADLACEKEERRKEAAYTTLLNDRMLEAEGGLNRTREALRNRSIFNLVLNTDGSVYAVGRCASCKGSWSTAEESHNLVTLNGQSGPCPARKEDLGDELERRFEQMRRQHHSRQLKE